MSSADLDLLEFLQENTMRGNWEAVVEKYAEKPEAQKLPLTPKGDTALHLAIIDNQEEIVERLVKLICRSRDYKQHLEAKNKRYNNPLHLAAALGSAKMCHIIASAHENLVHKKNIVGETPLFLAALYGHKDAFYSLYYFCRHNLTQATNNCSRSNGDTVLHFVLKNEHFDLAFQLIHMHKDAAHWVNTQGFTPLHILACKPNSFKSGTHIWGWRKIIYNWICVDQLRPQSIETLSEAWKKSIPKTNTTTSYFPANYHTCIHFFTSLWDGFLKVSTLKLLVNKKKSDEAKKDKDLEEDVNVETDRSAKEPPVTNFPKIYNTCIDFCQIIFSIIMTILRCGFADIQKIREVKQKHIWSVQVMEKLLEFGLKKPDVQIVQHTETPHSSMGEMFATTSDWIIIPYGQAIMPVMLLAAKYGVMEMVMELFKRFRTTIHDTTEDEKNIVLLAAECRQLHVYRFLLEKKDEIESLFRAVDKYGNSALHLAAAVGTSKHLGITGAALQMQWEVRWYKESPYASPLSVSFQDFKMEYVGRSLPIDMQPSSVLNNRKILGNTPYVENSVPHHFFAAYNKDGKTSSSIFEETHVDLVQKGEDWLYKTSQSCSVVATLIATVAFATAATVPGGNDDHGAAVLEKEQGFFIFSISSLIALCLSIISIIMFLSILTSRFGAKDFGSNLPSKMLIGLSSLYFSIVAMLISFCSGHYFLIAHRLQHVPILLYTLIFLPIILIFGILQLPLFFDLLKPIREIVPSGGTKDVVFN